MSLQVLWLGGGGSSGNSCTQQGHVALIFCILLSPVARDHPIHNFHNPPVSSLTPADWPILSPLALLIATPGLTGWTRLSAPWEAPFRAVGGARSSGACTGQDGSVSGVLPILS